nr:MAG TPA: hypothetical protein [Ackermannviridae sp.]
MRELTQDPLKEFIAYLKTLEVSAGQQKGVHMSKIDKKLLVLIKSLTKEQKEFILHFIQYFFKADLQ